MNRLIGVLIAAEAELSPIGVERFEQLFEDDVGRLGDSELAGEPLAQLVEQM